MIVITCCSYVSTMLKLFLYAWKKDTIELDTSIFYITQGYMYIL